MAVTINGSTGIAGVDGSASTPAVQGTDTNTGIAFPAADTVAVATGGTERMRLDASGNMGIGTSSPATRLDVSGAITTRGAVPEVLYIETDTSTTIRTLVDGSAWDVRRNDYSVLLSVNNATGDFQFDSGYGSAATAYGCRAWVNFNGTGTPAIRASGNVSSITDHSTGAYSINMTNALTDVNYAVVGQAGSTSNTRFGRLADDTTARTTTAFRILIIALSTTDPADAAQINIAVFR